MKLDQVARRARRFDRDRLPRAQQHGTRQEHHPRARPEGHRGAQVQPEPPRPQPRGRQEPQHRRHRVEHREPLLPRHLQGRRRGRPSCRVRAHHGQHRLQLGASGHQRPADDRPARRGAGGHRLRDGRRPDRGAQRRPDPGGVLRCRRATAEHHEHPRQLPPRDGEADVVPLQPRSSSRGIRGAPRDPRPDQRARQGAAGRGEALHGSPGRHRGRHGHARGRPPGRAGAARRPVRGRRRSSASTT